MKKIISILIAIIMLATFLTGCGFQVNWDALILNKQLPEPASLSGKAIDNTDEALWVELKVDTKDEFEQYISSCQDAGFTIDSKRQEDAYIESDELYFAYNEEGYRLELIYNSDDKTLTIDLNAPIEMTDLDWPFNDLAKELPQPQSSKGHVEREEKDNFSVYIGDTSIEDYEDYIKACKKAGFDETTSKGETTFYAQSEDGYLLQVFYVGFNTMQIELYSPEHFHPNDDADAE